MTRSRKSASGATAASVAPAVDDATPQPGPKRAAPRPKAAARTPKPAAAAASPAAEPKPNAAAEPRPTAPEPSNADDDRTSDRPGREPGDLVVAMSPRQIIGGFAVLAGLIVMLRRRRRDKD